MNLSLKNDAVFQIVGPSGCGKTMFVTQLLSDTAKWFETKIKTIYWLKGIDDNEVGETAKEFKHLKNIVRLNGFENGWMDKPQKGDAMVIDDLFVESTKEKNFNNLFTKIARHRGIVVIFITQNMFHQGGEHRTRNLNVHYLALFKNPRDATVVDYVARQAFPNNKKFLIDAFHDATQNKPYGYLFFDFTQTCPEEVRVRTNIFDYQNGIVVYKQNDGLGNFNNNNNHASLHPLET
jgi:hypothetical protein